jgi:hypothetical protein
MSEQAVVQSIAEDSKPAVAEKPKTEAEFIASRIAKRKEKQTKQPPAPEKSEASATVVKEEKKPEPPEAKAENEAVVLSKPINELTEEEIAVLANNGKSGLLKRLSEITAKRKQSEEQYNQRIAALEAKLQKQEAPAPERIENNPYESISDITTLNGKRKEVETLLETFDDVLDKADGLSASEIILESEGKQYTKAEIKELRRKAIKAKDKYLPAQHNEIVMREQGKQLEAQLSQQARKEISWVENNEDDTTKRYASMINDPRVLKAKKLVPELAPQLDYILAHAANSMWGRRLIVDDKPSNGKSPSLTPPSSPSTSTAAPTNVDARKEKSIKELESRFRESQSTNDYLALRTAKHQLRKRI